MKVLFIDNKSLSYSYVFTFDAVPSFEVRDTHPVAASNLTKIITFLNGIEHFLTCFG